MARVNAVQWDPGLSRPRDPAQDLSQPSAALALLDSLASPTR